MADGGGGRYCSSSVLAPAACRRAAPPTTKAGTSNNNDGRRPRTGREPYDSVSRGKKMISTCFTDAWRPSTYESGTNN